MKKYVALEIAASSIKAVEIANPLSKNPSILRYGELSLPNGLAEEATIFDPDSVGILLKEFWEFIGFSTNVVSLGISGRRIMVRDYEAPMLPLKKIKETLTFEAAELLPSQIEHSVLDFYPVSQAEDKTKVKGLLVAVSSESIEKIILTLNLAGLTVEYVDLSAFGLARAARRMVGSNTEYMIVNINPQTSEVIAMKNGAPQVIRVLPNGIPTRADARRQKDENRQPALNDQGSRFMNPVDSLLGAIRATIDYYITKGGNVENVYLTGEGSLNVELQEKVTQALRIPTNALTLDQLIGPPTEQGQRDLELEAALVSTASVGMRGFK